MTQVLNNFFKWIFFSTTNIREPLMRISMVDSGYEPHHPSLDSQISQTSHVSVSTPVQVTDGSDDFHPLMRTISHDPGENKQKLKT